MLDDQRGLHKAGSFAGRFGGLIVSPAMRSASRRSAVKAIRTMPVTAMADSIESQKPMPIQWPLLDIERSRMDKEPLGDQRMEQLITKQVSYRETDRNLGAVIGSRNA
jgi:hypothetical protein